MKNILTIQTQTQNVPISTTIPSMIVVISNIVVVSTTIIPPILVAMKYIVEKPMTFVTN
jgi:hypothetical protein